MSHLFTVSRDPSGWSVFKDGRQLVVTRSQWAAVNAAADAVEALRQAGVQAELRSVIAPTEEPRTFAKVGRAWPAKRQARARRAREQSPPRRL